MERSAKKVFQRSTLEQEGEEYWEGSAKKVAEVSDASRKYVARVGLTWRLRLLSGRAGGGAGIP